MKHVQAAALFMLVALTLVAPGGRAVKAADAVRINGKYYYRTDQFGEDCGAPTLAIQTSWANNASAFTAISRGQVKFVKPAQAPNGSFAWHCGNPLINGTDYSECNKSPVDYVRVLWSPASDKIDMQCFKICGTGATAANCAAF